MVERVVSQLHQDKVDQVWMEAAPLFQGSVTAAELARLERERRAVLGAFRQVLTVTRSKKSPGRRLGLGRGAHRVRQGDNHCQLRAGQDRRRVGA